MRHYLITFISILIISCNNSGSVRTYDNNFMTPQNQLIHLFSKDQYIATVISNKELTTKQKNILKKLMYHLSTNEKLQNEFDKILENPDLIYSNRSLGLSKNEVTALLSIFTKKQTSTERDTISVFSNDGYINFKGSGRLSVLDSLIINTKDTSSIFNQQQLDYYKPDSTSYANQFIPTDDQLETLFAFNGPNGISSLLQKNNKYLLIIGRLSKSGKTYLYLEIPEQYDINTPFRSFYSIILN